MAFIHSPKIVTDGLVAHFDSANVKSFVSGTIRIKNLGTSNISASISASNADLFVGGVGNAIRTTAPLLQSGIQLEPLTNFPEVDFTRSDNFTMCVWAALHKIDVAPSGSTLRGVFARGSFAGFVGVSVSQLTPSSSAALAVGTRAGSTIRIVTLKSSLITGSNPEIFNAVLVYKSSSFDGYLNGQFIGTASALLGEATFSLGIPPSYAHNSYGGYGGNPGPATMSFYNASIYNRALTADEVRQNYNAMRSRFGV